MPPELDRGEASEQTVPGGSSTTKSISASPFQVNCKSISRTSAASTTCWKYSAWSFLPSDTSRSMVDFASLAARVARSFCASGHSFARTPAHVHRNESGSSSSAASLNPKAYASLQSGSKMATCLQIRRDCFFDPRRAR